MVDRARLRRLERKAPKPDVALLEDGTRVELAPGERLAALFAAMDGEDHRLHDLLPGLAPHADPTLHGLRDMIWALSEGAGEGERRA